MNILQSYYEILDSDKPLVGGKSWAVAKLAQVDIPVPKGFCVTSELTNSIKRTNEAFEKEYQTYLKSVDSSGVPDQALAHRIKILIDNIEFPKNAIFELKSFLKDYLSSSSKKIIVRSSANIEDTLRSSFAGQFRSVIEDNSIDALVKAIKDCWKIIVSPSLAAYAFAMKVKLSGVSFAFLVQEFLEFDYAGVLFTRNPVKRKTRDYLVEYAEGGAEKIVSGRIIPNRCLLKDGGKNIEWQGHSSETGHPSEEALLLLGRLATKARKLFREEQDIEWGILGSSVFILQSRPLTASLG